MATAGDFKMLWVLYFVVFCLSGLCMGGRLYVTHSPDHVPFNDNHNAVHASELPDVIASSYGFPIKDDLEWTGLGPGQLFHRPKGQVLMNIQDAPRDSLSFPASKYYPLIQDGELNTEPLASRIQHRASQNSPLIIDYSLDTNLFDMQSRHPDLLANIPLTFSALSRVLKDNDNTFTADELGTLNLTKDTDRLFLSEIYVIRKIINALTAHPEFIDDGVPDLYHFRIVGLRSLANEYSKKGAPQMEDAMKLVEKLASEVTDTFKSLYDGNVVVHVAVQKRGEQTEKSRTRRSLKQAGEGSTKTIEEMMNVASDYTFMYAISFNLIFWLTVMLIIVTTCVSYGMWFMDPGRDSIIYRMTSQRIKMD